MTRTRTTAMRCEALLLLPEALPAAMVALAMLLLSPATTASTTTLAEGRSIAAEVKIDHINRLKKDVDVAFLLCGPAQCSKIDVLGTLRPLSTLVHSEGTFSRPFPSSSEKEEEEKQTTKPSILVYRAYTRCDASGNKGEGLPCDLEASPQPEEVANATKQRTERFPYDERFVFVVEHRDGALAVRAEGHSSSTDSAGTTTAAVRAEAEQTTLHVLLGTGQSANASFYAPTLSLKSGSQAKAVAVGYSPQQHGHVVVNLCDYRGEQRCSQIRLLGLTADGELRYDSYIGCPLPTRSRPVTGEGNLSCREERYASSVQLPGQHDLPKNFTLLLHHEGDLLKVRREGAPDRWAHVSVPVNFSDFTIRPATARTFLDVDVSGASGINRVMNLCLVGVTCVILWAQNHSFY